MAGRIASGCTSALPGLGAVVRKMRRGTLIACGNTVTALLVALAAARTGNWLAAYFAATTAFFAWLCAK